MGKKKKYRLYKNEQYIGEFYSKEICGMIGIAPKTFYTYVANGYSYNGCYTFTGENGTNYTQKDLEIMAQWDRYRKILNPAAGKEK